MQLGVSCCNGYQDVWRQSGRLEEGGGALEISALQLISHFLAASGRKKGLIFESSFLREKERFPGKADFYRASNFYDELEYLFPPGLIRSL